MDGDTSVQGDYQNGISSDAAYNAGRQAALSGQNLAAQQPGESAEAYQARQNAYNQAKSEQR